MTKNIRSKILGPKSFIITMISLLHFPSQAYYSVMDTAELVDHGKYLATLESQFITEGESGINLIGKADGRLTEESGYRVEFGLGVVDYNLAAFYKWSPIPDTDKQPAMSLSAGVSVARYEFGNESATDLSVRVHPVISKNFATEIGLLTPFAAIPLGIRNVEGESDLVAQLVAGSQLKPDEFKNMRFIAELGFDIEEAFTFISLGFQLGIDPEEGIRFE